jgi:hypothetical protein
VPKFSLEQYIQEKYDPAQMREIMRLLEDVNTRRFKGRIAEMFSSASIPTSGVWGVGDEVENSNPLELGGAGSMYIIKGWKCIGSGSPGTWREMRVLTGN